MKQTKLIKQSIIALISWTLCSMPIAIHADGIDIVELPNADISQSTDPNFCTNDASYSSLIKDCTSQGLSLNCHLKVCTSDSNNQDYNKEYQKCDSYPLDQRQKCRDNLKDFGNDLAKYNKDMEAGVSSGTDTSTITAASSIIGMGCVAYYDGCTSDFGSMQIAAVGLAIAFMAMQGKQYKKQFAQADEMLKSQDKNDVKGWDANTQSAALTKQIMAIDMIIKAAEGKSKNHKMVAALAGVVGAMALICVAGSAFGCTASNPCAVSASVGSFIVMALELKAAMESDSIASTWKKNKAIAEELKRKLDLLYKKGSEHIANMNGANPGATIAGTRAQTQLQSTLANTKLESFGSEQLIPRSCVSSDNSVSDCPCVGGNCAKLKFNLPNTAIANQVSSRLNTSAWEDAANQAFGGDTSKLESLSTDGNLALISGIKNKLLKHTLDKKLVSGKDKDMFNALLNPKDNQKLINSYVASRLDPVKGATLASMYSAGDLEGLSKNEMEKNLVASNSQYKAPTYKEKSNTSDLLKQLEDQLNFDDLDGAIEDHSKKHNLVDTGLNTETVREEKVEVEFNDINPETKLNIFKIISNRYNVMKSQKKIGN